MQKQDLHVNGLIHSNPTKPSLTKFECYTPTQAKIRHYKHIFNGRQQLSKDSQLEQLWERYPMGTEDNKQELSRDSQWDSSKTGQIAHIFSSSSGIAQKTILECHTAEATCRPRMGCWCQNTMHSALSLVYSTAENCTPVWCCSTHTHLIDSVLNNTLCIVIGCLCPTPTDRLPILSDIPPAELCRLGATLSLAYCGSLNPDHILYGLLNGSSDAHQERLRFRCPFVPAVWNLLNNLARLGIYAEWTNHKWNAEYWENTSRLCVFIPRTSARPVGMSFP